MTMLQMEESLREEDKEEKEQRPKLGEHCAAG